MSSPRVRSAVILLVLVCLSVFTTLSCNIAEVPGRFTYVVKYSVSFTEAAPPSLGLNPNVERVDDTGSKNPSGPVTSAWSEEFTFSYATNGYDNQFVPEMTVTETLDEAGESMTMSIIWKDYKTDFEEEVLAYYTATYSSTTINVNETLFGTPLPK
jgi:hypothetical protein